MGRVIRVETVCQYGKCFKLLWAVQEKQGVQMSGNAPFFKPFFADFSIKNGGIKPSRVGWFSPFSPLNKGALVSYLARAG